MQIRAQAFAMETHLPDASVGAVEVVVINLNQIMDLDQFTTNKKLLDKEFNKNKL